MTDDEDFKVMWVHKDGARHDDEDYYPGRSAASHRAMEIMAEHRADIHRIWLQGRKVQL